MAKRPCANSIVLLMMKTPAIFSVILLTASFCFAEDRVHTKAQLFINNYTSGPKNGCSTKLGEKGDMTCGHPVAVSRIVWKYLSSDSTGDNYQFTRHLVSNSEMVSSNTISVVYKGAELELWKDAKQKVILRPLKDLKNVEQADDGGRDD